MTRVCQIGIRVTEKRDAELRALAKSLGWSLSELINRLLDDALAARNGKK